MNETSGAAPRPVEPGAGEEPEKSSLGWILLGVLAAFMIWLPLQILAGSPQESALEEGLEMGLFLGCGFAMDEFRFRRERLRKAAATFCLVMAMALAVSFVYDLVAG